MIFLDIDPNVAQMLEGMICSVCFTIMVVTGMVLYYFWAKVKK